MPFPSGDECGFYRVDTVGAGDEAEKPRGVLEVRDETGELVGGCDRDGKLDELVRQGEVLGEDPEDVEMVRFPLGVDRFQAGRFCTSYSLGIKPSLRIVTGRWLTHRSKPPCCLLLADF